MTLASHLRSDYSVFDHLWVEAPVSRKTCAADDMALRARVAGFPHVTYYTAARDDESGLQQVMLVRTTVRTGWIAQELLEHTRRMTTGYMAVAPVPEALTMVSNLVLHDDGGSSDYTTAPETGARDVEVAIRTDSFDTTDDCNRLLLRYLEKISVVMQRREIRWSGQKTARWLIDHWNSGDEGCRELLETGTLTTDSDDEGQWEPIEEHGVQGLHKRLRDGTKASIMVGRSQVPVLFHRGKFVATGPLASLQQRCATLVPPRPRLAPQAVVHTSSSPGDDDEIRNLIRSVKGE